jgi:hypothetical protein
MSTSEARILANQANAKLSTGPKSPSGKVQSRANSYKHGMTGEGIVLPEADAVEVSRRAASFATETNASGDIAHSLARRAALNSVRMERGADQQAAALSKRVRQVEADFVAPEGADEAQAAELLSEAIRIAMFDPSREASLARRYEAAAERGFFRALKDLRQLEKKAKLAAPVVDDATFQKSLASLFHMEKTLNEREARHQKSAPTPPSKPQNRIEPGYLEKIDDIFDMPMAIGKRR